MEELKTKAKEIIKDVRTKHPPFIKANLYAVTDVMLVVALLFVLVAIFEKDKMVKLMMMGGFATSVGFAGLSAGAQIFQGKTVVKNRSKNSIYAKPEEGSDTFEVLPGKNVHDIDGIKSNGTVYKIGDSCHAVVRKDGSVKIKSFIGRLINKYIDGGVLTSPPDDSWNKLFDC